MDLFSRVIKVRNSYHIGLLIVLSFLFFGRVAGAEVISGILYEIDGETTINVDMAVDVFQSSYDDPCQSQYIIGTGIDTTDGTYSIDVPAGDYYLRITNFDTNYIEEYWAPDASEIECQNAGKVTVVSGTSNTGKNFQLNIGGSISGNLSLDGSLPPFSQEMGVNVFKWENDEKCGWYEHVTGTGMNTDGSYLISGVPPGTYYLNTWSNGTPYVDEYWADSASTQNCQDAQTVTVAAANHDVVGKHFQLAMGGSVSGTLYETDGETPITNNTNLNIMIRKGADSCNSDHIKGTSVNSDGTYLIEGVLPGDDYYLEIYAEAGSYVEEYWAETLSAVGCQNAESITVEANVVTEWKNFQLDIGGSVSGTLYETDGETPITGNTDLHINIRKGTDPCNNDYVTGNRVNSDGTYLIEGVLPGDDYYLEIYVEAGSYIEEYWAETLSAVGCQNAESITVEANVVTEWKNFQLDIGGSVSGILFDSESGLPIEDNTNLNINIRKGADSCNSDHVKGTSVNSDGTYTIEGILPGDDYYLEIWADGGDYVQEYWADPLSLTGCQNAENVVVVANEETEWKHFQLDIGGSISGIVYRTDGTTALTGESIKVRAYTGSDGCNRQWANSTYTNSEDGTYTINRLPEENIFIRAGDDSSSYTQEFWVDQTNSDSNCNNAGSIPVTSGNDTPNINFQLDESGSVSGVVYQSEGGNPLTGVDMWVNAFAGGNACYFEWVGGGDLNTTDGTYTISGLEAGTYYIRTGSRQSDYVSEFWADSDSVIDCGGAEEIIITAGNNTPEKHFQLVEGGSISGTLFQTDGVKPLTGVSTNVRAYSGSNACLRTWVQRVSVDTETGTYRLRGIPAGNHFVRAGDDDSDYVREFWSSPFSDSACETAASIPVTAGAETIGKNFQMDLGFSISGTIFKTGGSSLLTGEGELEVSLFKDSSCNGYTNWNRDSEVDDADGTFIVRGLENGTYYLRADMDDAVGTPYIDEYYNNSGSVRSCLQAGDIVINNANRTGIDLQLDPGACTISGNIYNADGTPVGEDDGGVVAYPNNPCSSSEWASAGGPEDSSGVYEIGGLQPGTYYLHTIMNWSSNPNEWLNGSVSTYDCSEAQLVTCTEGIEAIDNDFILGLGLEHVILMSQIVIGQADVNRSIHLGMDKNNDGKIGLAEVVDAMRELADME